MCVLGIKSRSCGKAASALLHGALSPVPAPLKVRRVSPLLHGGRRVVEPRQIADHSLVISVVAPGDFHSCNLSQANFEMATKGVLMQRLGARLHVAL